MVERKNGGFGGGFWVVMSDSRVDTRSLLYADEHVEVVIVHMFK